MDYRYSLFLQNQLFANQLRRSMLWYTSDQAQEFDHWLRMPIRCVQVLQQLAGEHYERVSQIDPGGDVQLVYDSFIKLLRELDERGESSERLILWYATLDENDPWSSHPVVRGKPGAAVALWIDTLKRWARDDMLELRFAVHGIDKQIVHTYFDLVYLPVQKIQIKMWDAEAFWRDSDKNRSTWDNYLWSIYYNEVRTVPAGFLCFDVERMKHREWWRQVHGSISETQQQGLLNELVEDLYRSDSPIRMQDRTLMSMDEAFEVDKYPEFNKVARDW